MPHPKLPDAEFVAQFRELGAEEMQRRNGGNLRAIYERRRNLEVKLGICLSPPHKPHLHPQVSEHPGVIPIDVQNGVVLVGSDAHIWPGPMSTAMRGFIKFCKELKPKVVIMNGDVTDFPRISRHPPIGWTRTPTVQEEIEACAEQLHEVAAASGKARKLWPLGNHDARFETKIASVAPEFAKVAGTRLADHFPLWEGCWRVDVNDDVVVKHRHKGGIHATHNSTMWAGKTTVTGHLHSLKVTPFTDYNGTRWGVDTGCLADVGARAFLDYTEAGPLNWRSGFGVLTFKDGRLLWPEIASVFDQDHIEFRGSVEKV
jgi:hypothetical protein